MRHIPDADRALVIGAGDGRRQIAAVLIEESGFHVDEARNCREAEALVAQNPAGFRFIFADSVGDDEVQAFVSNVERKWPWIRLLVSTGSDAPGTAPARGRLRSPWLPLDLLVEAERAIH